MDIYAENFTVPTLCIFNRPCLNTDHVDFHKCVDRLSDHVQKACLILLDALTECDNAILILHQRTYQCGLCRAKGSQFDPTLHGAYGDDDDERDYDADFDENDWPDDDDDMDDDDMEDDVDDGGYAEAHDGEYPDPSLDHPECGDVGDLASSPIFTNDPTDCPLHDPDGACTQCGNKSCSGYVPF